jgi:hypothetical protein
MARLNIKLDSFEPVKPYYSLIYRNYQFERQADSYGYGAFTYESKSFTNFIALDYMFETDITITVFISSENNQIDYQSDSQGKGSEQKQVLKSGSSIKLSF